ncbi:hypothetical protein BDA96_02G063500 [Sorghum bicolor]|uniref:Uncharacterized protein n=2 Tax=Sorghum bicolor TaxID=4558 RepID=C5XBV6_SORBI|nr:hypothetical protein SORBI_3002G063400 [Sorghum bicolor]KAG0541985.1 hypothetical protein BDA96_02G063500 [Sorghum bicolor]
MGLLSIIRKIKRKEKEMRILMVGPGQLGEDNHRFQDQHGEDTSVISPTLGFNIKTIKYHKYSLNIWDVGGQKTIRLDDCRAELHNLLKEERLAGASLLVFANKQRHTGSSKTS